MLVDLVGRCANPRLEGVELEKLEAIRAEAGKASRRAPEHEIRDVARRLGKERVAELVRDYESGIPSTQLMIRYRISKPAVLRLLKDNDVPMRRQGVTLEQTESAKQMYEDGDSLGVLARELGIPKQSIRLALLDHGVQMRPPTGR